jgi:hypothetical protein
VRKVKSLPNFKVTPSLFYIFSIVSLLVDTESFSKRDFVKLSCKIIMFSKAYLNFMVLSSPTLHVFIY